jgi:hypothetical protein
MNKKDCLTLAAKHNLEIVLPAWGSVQGDLMIQINLPDGYLTDENTTGYSLFFNPADTKKSLIWATVYNDIQKLISQKPWSLEKIEVSA